VLIDLANPSRDVLEQVSAASDAKGRPVAMFVDKSDDNMTSAAVAAGLSAYVVGNMMPERIKPVLKTAIARFQMVSQMRRELEAAKKALADRKVIDRAKGLLMRARGISEEDAYALLRSTAMDRKKKVIDVAEALITATDLLK
jgi:response regulator NasT